MPGTARDELDIQFTTTNDVLQEDMERTREIVAGVLARAPRPVLHARATLSVLHDPAVPRPNLISVQVDLNGLPVEAHAAAPSMPEAISLAGTRLRARVENTIQCTEPGRRAPQHTTTTGHGIGRGR
ncbi:hypothetical protein [Actinomadura latina]|uniref:HPF/RaiA family ribosome-associated protein n=1 Tax=Actinomadura latina TaxID=163603 RepID=A0A846Z4W4_9ACTN|nr:hypothetical protein [Actinomadura latina]NKZ08049.1 hypothetical protein [Actinomadura latina]